MQLQTHAILRSIMLSACVLPLAATAVSQEPSQEGQAAGLIQEVTAPRLGPTSYPVPAGARGSGGSYVSQAQVRYPAQPPTTVPFPQELPPQSAPFPRELPPQSPPFPPALPPTGQASPSDQDGSLAPLQSRELSLQVTIVDLSIKGIGTGVLPEPASLERASAPVLLPGGFERGAVFKSVQWTPSNICHFPLYFEEPMLERHGHVRFGHLQPLVSGVKFFGTLPLLPYRQTLQPPHQPVYVLGQWRPGSCAPLVRESLPYDSHAAVVETLALASFFWAAPW